MTDKTWLPQRWDVGQWDQAVWDGQLGFNAQLGAVNVNVRTANFVLGHVLSAQKASIVVNGIATGLYAGISLPVSTGSIVVTGNPAGVTFTVRKIMACGTGQIRVNAVAGQCTLTAFLQPGPLNFGVQRVMIPNRW